MGNEEICGRNPDRGGAANAGDPDDPHAGKEEQSAPDQRDQHCLAKIGLQHETSESNEQKRKRHSVCRHFRPARRFTE